MNEQAMDRLKKARAKMLVKHPFFATLMMSMPMVHTTEIPTAATDMKTLYVNPVFIDSIDDDVLMFVIAHEIMHTALEHGLRRQSRVPLRWNVAADYAINLILKDSKFRVWEQALLDEKYRDMSADKIYDLLTKEEHQQPQSGDGQGQGSSGDQQGQASGSGSSDPNASPQGKGSGGPPKIGEPGNTHHSPMLGDLKEPDVAGDPAAEDSLRRDIQQRVAQAATIARMTGNLPGSLERFVRQVLEPQVPWFDVLRHFMMEFAPDDEDWSRRNRRFEMYLPADHSERMGEFVAVGDTSGSISDEEMCKYVAEFVAVAEDVKPERIRLVWADTRVAGEQLFEEGELIEVQPKGGGGTDMRVPLKHVEQYEPQVVVLFTDGHTPWPDYVPYPLIVCCTTGVDVPVGEVIRL